MIPLIQDIKDGSPKTKLVSKKLFANYQEMGRSQIKYKDKLEFLEMYNDKNDDSERFNSIEAHNTFKSIEE